MSAEPGGLHLDEVVEPASGEGTAQADDIETMRIGLEKGDTAVDEVAPVWIPR
ncbi:MAG: hypothetical protein ACN0LA_14460 [Candidatus Longimicrobiales bacterium M2_2A_002]